MISGGKGWSQRRSCCRRLSRVPLGHFAVGGIRLRKKAGRGSTPRPSIHSFLGLWKRFSQSIGILLAQPDERKKYTVNGVVTPPRVRQPRTVQGYPSRGNSGETQGQTERFLILFEKTRFAHNDLRFSE